MSTSNPAASPTDPMTVLSSLRTQALGCLPDALRNTHQRLVQVVPSCDGFGCCRKRLQFPERQLVPQAMAKDNWDDDRPLRVVPLKCFIEFVFVTIFRGNEVGRNEEKHQVGLREFGCNGLFPFCACDDFLVMPLAD